MCPVNVLICFELTFRTTMSNSRSRSTLLLWRLDVHLLRKVCFLLVPEASFLWSDQGMKYCMTHCHFRAREDRDVSKNKNKVGAVLVACSHALPPHTLHYNWYFNYCEHLWLLLESVPCTLSCSVDFGSKDTVSSNDQ